MFQNKVRRYKVKESKSDLKENILVKSPWCL